MALAFIVNGIESTLTSKFSPPIILDEGKRYGLALFGFQYFNAIENVVNGCDTFHYQDKSIDIPHGAYEVNDIHDHIFRVLSERHPDILSKTTEDKFFSLTSNNTTLKCEIRSVFDIDFSKPNSIAPLLGFSKKVIPKEKSAKSDRTVEILAVSCIRIACPIIRGSFLGSRPSQILGTVFIKTPPGYLISYDVENVIYFEVCTNIISELTILLLDQENRPVNLNKEIAQVYLVLKEI